MLGKERQNQSFFGTRASITLNEKFLKALEKFHTALEKLYLKSKLAQRKIALTCDITNVQSP